MLHIFLQPYPFQNNKKTAVIICTIAGLIIFSIFCFFKPFGLENDTSGLYFKVGLLYGLVTFVVSAALTVSLPTLFPKVFEEKNWIVIKEIGFLLFIVSCIAIANVVATNVFYRLSFSMAGLLSMLKYTFSFAIFPVLFSVLFKQQLLVKKYKTEANFINQNRIKKDNLPIKVTSENEKAVFIGDNANEKLEIDGSNFICAESEENYTTLYYLENESIKKTLFRVSLKKLENQNEKLPNFYRCHKSFYVNLDKVNQLSGNAQGYKLHFEHLQFFIPVSRSLNAVIKQKITV
jgi:LytTr DNA-binding domain